MSMVGAGSERGLAERIETLKDTYPAAEDGKRWAFFTTGPTTSRPLSAAALLMSHLHPGPVCPSYSSNFHQHHHFLEQV
jgi:hypothetical protein